MILKPNQFFIRGNVPSSKNGRRCMCNKRATKKDGSTGSAGILLGSPQLEQYLSSTKMQWFDQGRKFRDYVKRNNLTYPLRIRFDFIRTNKQSFDWTGPLETVQDCMTGGKFESCLKGLRLKKNPWAWLPDDSVHYLTPDIAASTHRVATGKDVAGVVIEIMH